MPDLKEEVVGGQRPPMSPYPIRGERSGEDQPCNRSRLRLPGWTLGIVLALVLGGCSVNPTNAVAPSTVSKNDLEPGSRALIRPDRRPLLPALRGEGLDGRPIDLRAMRGDVVVLNVWASWCAPCRAEASQLAAVWRKTTPLGVRFVGIDIKDDRTAAKAFQRNFKVPYASIYDQPGRLLLALRALAPQVPPTTLLVDRAGRLAARFPGGITEAVLLGPVQQLAAEGT